MGLSLDDCVVYNPHKPNGGLTAEELRAAKMILWRGHCSVHGRFSLESVEDVRKRIPDVNVLVHPECKHEVVAAADYVGSTEYIIKALEAAPRGSKWAIGTELNLVRRLANRFAEEDKEIVFLDKTVCFCSTMNRIDLPHLVWTLESLAAGKVVNLSLIHILMGDARRPPSPARRECDGRPGAGAAAGQASRVQRTLSVSLIAVPQGPVVIFFSFTYAFHFFLPSATSPWMSVTTKSFLAASQYARTPPRPYCSWASTRAVSGVGSVPLAAQ